MHGDVPELHRGVPVAKPAEQHPPVAAHGHGVAVRALRLLRRRVSLLQLPRSQVSRQVSADRRAHLPRHVLRLQRDPLDVHPHPGVVFVRDLAAPLLEHPGAHPSRVLPELLGGVDDGYRSVSATVSDNNRYHDPLGADSRESSQFGPTFGFQREMRGHLVHEDAKQLFARAGKGRALQIGEMDIHSSVDSRSLSEAVGTTRTHQLLPVSDSSVFVFRRGGGGKRTHILRKSRHLRQEKGFVVEGETGRDRGNLNETQMCSGWVWSTLHGFLNWTNSSRHP